MTDKVLARANGATVVDVEGKEYLDFESGQVCMATGHSHPFVLDVLYRQSQRLMQIGSNFTSREEILLAEALRERAPQMDARVYLGSTGSESNEAAIRLAKKATGRFEVVGVLGAYHGLTLGSWSLTTFKEGSLAGYGPTMPGTVHIPTPNPYRCLYCADRGGCTLACANAAEDIIDRGTSGAPAAFIYEVVLSGGGVIVPPREWFQRMQEICKSRGILMIADEAQTGMGRCGAWFASERVGVIPDIMTLSKTLGGGVPLSAVVATGEVAEKAVAAGFSQSSSHNGDPFTAAAGLANIAVIEREKLIERARNIGDQLAERLTRLRDQLRIVGDVRGLGSIWGIEVTRPGSKEPWFEGAAQIFNRAREEGLILSLRPTERDRRNVIRVIPPLVIDDDTLGRALDVIDRVAKEVDAAV